MGWYSEYVVPHIVELTLGNKSMAPVRRPALEGLRGTVVELGFGSGTNLGLYPPEVERVLAVEPSRVAREMSAKRRAAHPEPPVEFVGLDGAAVPLDDGIADAVVSTFTLCTIPDVHGALAETARILRPGGELHFLEHGLSDDPGVARWQRRLEPVQMKIADGCHLTREPEKLVVACALEQVSVQRFTIRGPRFLTAMRCGVARKAS